MTYAAISLTLNNHRYIEQVAQHFNNLEGLSDIYGFFIGAEPRFHEHHIIPEFKLEPTTFLNLRQLGVRMNPYTLLTNIFNDGYDYIVYLEDDVIFSPDILKIAEWYYDNSDENCLCLNLFNYKSKEENPSKIIKSPKDNKTTLECRNFTALDFILTKEAWIKYFQPNWFKDYRGWDHSINELLKHNEQLYTLQPEWSRSNHIGIEGGTHFNPDQYQHHFKNIKIYQGISCKYALSNTS